MDNKDDVIRIRISKEDKEALKDRASSMGLTISGYISYLIYKDRREER